MKLGIAGDFHAGYGKDDPEVRTMMATAIRRSAEFLSDQDCDVLCLNGDITDHVGTALEHENDPELCTAMSAPIVRLLKDHRGSMETILIAGNTDPIIASSDPEERQKFFEYTGINPADVTITRGGLKFGWETEGSQRAVVVTHGHTQKPAAWGKVGPMEKYDQQYLVDMLDCPTIDFLRQISAIDGSHREDFLKAQKIGKFVRPFPGFLRRSASWLAGNLKMRQEYEPQFAKMLQYEWLRYEQETMGVMGHTHVAGSHQYDGIHVLNHGSAGAKPNPLETVHDPKAHVLLIDDMREEFQLVCTYNANRPMKKPTVVRQGNLFND